VNVQSSTLALAERLTRLLETEFEALKARNLEGLEKLAEQREALLTQLLYLKQTDQARWQSEGFAPVRATLDECQGLHKRNELLLSRQLDAVRQALSTLRKSSDDADLYDRLGKLARRRGHLFSDDV
jgi:flagellar biosynthesis/type III secretory pathway chaperone